MKKLQNKYSMLKRFVVSAAILASTTTAFAHVHLISASPAVNASTSVAPKNLTLNFGSDVMLMNIKVVDSQQKNVPLNYEINHSMKKSFDVPVANLDKGKYTVNWTAMGNDGHNMNGSYSFTIEPNQ